MARKSPKGTYVTLSLLVVGQCLYVFALFVAADFLHNNDVPILSYTFALLAASGVVFLAIQRAWSGFRRLTRKQTLALGVNGVLLVVTTALASFGLKYCGPVRAVLLSFSEHCFVYLPALLCGWGGLRGGSSAGRRRGVVLMLLAYAALLMTSEYSVHDDLVGEDTQQVGEAASIAGPPEVGQGVAARLLLAVKEAVVAPSSSQEDVSGEEVHKFTVAGLLQFSEGAVGTLALIVGACLDSLRKRYARNNAKLFGGRKRLHAMSVCVGAALLVPLALLQQLRAPGSDEETQAAAAVGDSDPSEPTELSDGGNFGMTLGFVALFCSVLPFYVDSIAQRVGNTTLVQTNFVSSMVFAAGVDALRGDERLTFVAFVCSVGVFLGLRMVQGSPGRDLLGSPHHSTLIPMYQQRLGKSMSLQQQARLMWLHISQDQNTFRIFVFLVINFLFMFVELAYGVWTNSLGLISDAGHMLFDCAALAIGLYASYISKVTANGTYTYGYGRYEILSGFVNGIFLLFIGFFVFLEAVERLFEPPEVLTDSLITVSVLGFAVNMVGLIFFHDHHGHGGHGHSHGGGGGHGHSHGGDDVHNHNMEGIFLHILADTLGSVGVIISSVLIWWRQWYISDAICSILISGLITLSVYPLLKASAHILLQREPHAKTRQIDRALEQVRNVVGVLSYSNEHFWSFSDEELVGSIHVHVTQDADEQKVLNTVSRLLREGAGISNLTVQVDKGLTG